MLFDFRHIVQDTPGRQTICFLPLRNAENIQS